MDGNIGIGQGRHCTAMPTTTRYFYTTGKPFVYNSHRQSHGPTKLLFIKQNHMHAPTASHYSTSTHTPGIHNTHNLRSETSRSARHGNQDTPVPQLARSGPYSHDGEREALSQITITYHTLLQVISTATTTLHFNLLQTLGDT